jgi:hypothetical protein
MKRQNAYFHIISTPPTMTGKKLDIFSSLIENPVQSIALNGQH